MPNQSSRTTSAARVVEKRRMDARRASGICAGCDNLLGPVANRYTYYCADCRLEMNRWGNFKPQSATHAKASARTLRGRFLIARSGAKARGLDWTLTLDEYATAIGDGRCHYCDGLLSETGVALDRIDNPKGYIPGNIVPSCWLCNTVRANWFTTQEMERLGRVIRSIASKWPEWKRQRARGRLYRQRVLV